MNILKHPSGWFAYAMDSEGYEIPRHARIRHFVDNDDAVSICGTFKFESVDRDKPRWVEGIGQNCKTCTRMLKRSG